MPPFHFERGGRCGSDRVAPSFLRGREQRRHLFASKDNLFDRFHLSKHTKRTVGWFLLAHIVLPLCFGTAFIIFSAAVLPSIEGWDVLVETAQDLAILSLGATGAIFDNAKVEQAFGSNSAIVAIGLVAVNLILSAIIVFARARAIRINKHFSLTGGIMVLFLGFLTLAFTASVLVWAYKLGS